MSCRPMSLKCGLVTCTDLAGDLGLLARHVADGLKRLERATRVAHSARESCP